MSASTRTSVLRTAFAWLLVLASLAGTTGTSPAQEAPVGGFMPAPAQKATSYWERDGGPLDMKNPWRALTSDSYHDPLSDAVKKLQNPVESMRSLPRADTGNFVDWVGALKNGAIQPRAEVEKPGLMEMSNIDVIMRNTKTMPTVTFSHTIHTEWLACSNCHDEPFKRKAGTTKIRMMEIFQGKFCGVCHGKVAFPPDQCFRCHNGPRRQAEN